MKFPRAVAKCLVCSAFLSQVAAQTFQRLGTCPTLGCVFPPDQADFLPGQWFDIRLEVHAPQNGSERVPYSNPDSNFTFTIGKDGAAAVPVTEFFKIADPKLETWNFTWYEDLFARAAHTPSLVKVASKAYRKVALYEPGQYIATLSYQNGSITQANWTGKEDPNALKTTADKRQFEISLHRGGLRTVSSLLKFSKGGQVHPPPTLTLTSRPLLTRSFTAVLFIGDGMTTNMITAARLIAHQSINGKYQSLMAMDQFPALGHQVS